MSAARFAGRDVTEDHTAVVEAAVVVGTAVKFMVRVAAVALSLPLLLKCLTQNVYVPVTFKAQVLLVASPLKITVPAAHEAPMRTSV